MKRFVNIMAPAAFVAAWLGMASSSASAQRGAERAETQTIIIRAQVPTPQVITVRPREVPDYSKDVLGSERRDRSFWSSLLPAYQLVPQRQITGRSALDSSEVVLAGDAWPGARNEAGVGKKDSTAGARQAELDALRREIAERSSRLDSLERGVAGGRERETRGAASGARLSPADSAARANEIEALLRALEYHRARLDSLEAVVQSLGRPRAPGDTTATPRDTTRAPR